MLMNCQEPYYGSSEKPRISKALILSLLIFSLMFIISSFRILGRFGDQFQGGHQNLLQEEE